MESMIIPPTVNWYEPAIAACTHDNTVIYGARCDIVYMKYFEDKTRPLDVKIVSKAHSKRIKSVDVNLKWGQPKNHFVSLGEDNAVKLWNADDMTMESCQILDMYAQLVAAKFCGEDRVVIVSDDGNVVIWNIRTGNTNVLKDFLCVKSSVSCMSTCPHAPWLVAFGMESGLVVVADIRKTGTIHHRLPGHQKAVISLTWCPVPINIFPKNPINYVAHEKIDDTVHTEDLKTDPSVSNTLNPEPVPPVEAHLVDRLDDTNSQLKKQELDVQGSDGCTQPEDKHSKQEVEVPSVTLPQKIKPMREAPRKEFLLASSARDGKIHIWRAGTDGALQTLITPKRGKDRYKHKQEKQWIPIHWATPTKLLSCTKIFELIQYTLPKPMESSKQMSVVHECHQSLIFNITCPTVLFNENNWADEVHLNAWTFSQDHLLVNVRLNKEREILAHCSMIDGSVNCLSASPVNPTRLGLGTNHLKMWTMSSSRRSIINMSRLYHRIQCKIVRLAWHPTLESTIAFATSEGRIGYVDIGRTTAPKILRNHYQHQINKIEWGPVDEHGKLGIFALSGGELIAFDLNSDIGRKVEADKSDVPYVYTFAWKPNHARMLAASKTGSVFNISKDLEVSSVMYFESKTESIIWHPQGAVIGDSTSIFHNYCAFVRNGNTVLVMNLSSDCDVPKVVSSFTAKGNLVSAVSWSPFNDNLMVICTNSGVAEVWDVMANVVLSTCVDLYSDPIVCATWSPLSEDCIIMGCRDNALKVWRVSEHSSKNEDEIKELRNTAYKELYSRSDDRIDDPEEKKPTEEVKSKRPSDKLLAKSFHIRDSDHLITNIRKVLNWQSNPEDKDMESTTTKPDILSLFGNCDSVMDMLKVNEQLHVERKKFDKEVTLSLFRGDISSSIEAAINEHRVTPTIITFAPLISTKVWQVACETYAKQLAEEPDSDPVEIVVHYLLSHKIHEAIDVLCTARMYHEAFVIAKCRLTDEVDTITSVVDKWITYLIQNGNYEFAAVCYIYLEKYEEAATMLFKRSGKLLEVAKELANKAGNNALEEAISTRISKLKSETKEEKEDAPLPNRAELLLRIEEKTAEGEDSIEHGSGPKTDEQEGEDAIEHGSGPKTDEQ